MGLPRDVAAAFAYYCRAEAQGHSRAAKLLGDLHYSGQTPQGRPDFEAAMQMYSRSLETGWTSEAANAMGILFEDGKLGYVDLGQAFKHYQIAAAAVRASCSIPVQHLMICDATGLCRRML
jgi:TPR repeat protein